LFEAAHKKKPTAHTFTLLELGRTGVPIIQRVVKNKDSEFYKEIICSVLCMIVFGNEGG